jgi:hypothetical protein
LEDTYHHCKEGSCFIGNIVPPSLHVCINDKTSGRYLYVV